MSAVLMCNILHLNIWVCMFIIKFLNCTVQSFYRTQFFVIIFHSLKGLWNLPLWLWFLTLLIPPSHYTSRLSAIRPVSTNFLVPGAEDFSHCGWIRSSDPLAWKQTNTIIGVDGWRSRPRKGLCALRWAHVWEQGEESETQWDEVSLITGGETRKSKQTNGKIAGRLVSA